MTPDEVNRLSDLVYDTAPLPGPDGVQQPDFRHFMVCAANDPLNKSNWEEDWLNYRIERSRSAVIHAARELHKNGMDDRLNNALYNHLDSILWKRDALQLTLDGTLTLLRDLQPDVPFKKSSYYLTIERSCDMAMWLLEVPFALPIVIDRQTLGKACRAFQHDIDDATAFEEIRQARNILSKVGVKLLPLIENEKGSAMHAIQTQEDARETYPYFFLRDGTKVLAESQEAQAEFARLTKLMGYLVDRFNFYQVKGGKNERRILPERVNNQEDADRICRFICDGDSNWNEFLTQACKAWGGGYLPEGFMYHVNIERGKKEIQAAAEKLLEWNEGRLLSHAISHHLYSVSAYSSMYGVFRGDTISALQHAVIMRGIDGATWLLQLNAPRFVQTGVDLAALKKALVDAAHDLKDMNAHDFLSKARALFKIDSGVKPPPPPKPPAMSDPRRVHYYPLRDRGRTTVMTAAEGVRSMHEAFQQYQHGHDTHYITDAEMVTLAKWGFTTGHGIWGDLEAILIRDGKIDPAKCRELTAPQALSLLAAIGPKPIEDTATPAVLIALAGGQATPEQKKKPWHVVGLPLALNDLAIALEKLGGEAEASDIKKQTERNPSDTIGKYPKWKWWIDAWILRPKETGRMGVYGLRSDSEAKLILERTSKEPRKVS